MNLEISDEMIEKLVKDQVNTRVKDWFLQKEHKCIIREYVNQAVIAELKKFDYRKIVIDCAKEKVTKDMMEKIANQISNDIARAYADKYGDY